MYQAAQNSPSSTPFWVSEGKLARRPRRLGLLLYRLLGAWLGGSFVAVLDLGFGLWVGVVVEAGLGTVSAGPVMGFGRPVVVRRCQDPGPVQLEMVVAAVWPGARQWELRLGMHLDESRATPSSLGLDCGSGWDLPVGLPA